MNNFYIYVHTKTTDNSIFYVGRGVGRRCTNKQNRNAYWNKIVAKVVAAILARKAKKDMVI